MADVTVEQLAQLVKLTPAALLERMRAAGLPHAAAKDIVSDAQKTQFLEFVKSAKDKNASAEPAAAPPPTAPRTKITRLKRRDTEVSTLRGGKGGRGGSVKVETRRRKRVVIRTAPATPAATPADERTSPPETPATPPQQVAPAQEPPAVVEPALTETAAQAQAEQPAANVKVEQPGAEAKAERQDVEAKAERPDAAAPTERTERTERADRSEQPPGRPKGAAPRPARGRAAPPQRNRERTPRGPARATGRAKPAPAPHRNRNQPPSPEEVARATAEAAAKAQAAARAGGSGRRVGARGGQPGRATGRERGRDDYRASRENRDRRRELSLKQESRRTKRRHLSVEKQGGEFEKPPEFIVREVEVGKMVTVGDLAQGMSVKAGEVIKALMDLGVMATINQSLDQDTAILVVEELGHKVKLVVEDEVEQVLEKSLQVAGDRQPRPPVVTVMGHVDHGKTSLLDHIRNTRVVAGEAGGITQHIGAYHVRTEHGDMTFIDTPGHAAFTAMRARGARSTDVVILVVAANDGVMPQTEEAVQHARAAEVPMVVAVNKIDLEGADPDRVRNDLGVLDVIPEDWGGDVQFVNVSAATGEGVDTLLEAVTLQAELLELRAVPDAPARGVVIESRLDRGRGPVVTLLVQDGTLRRGDMVIAGQFYGRARALANERAEATAVATPSIPVEMLGLNGTPNAGDQFSAVVDERQARNVATFRADRNREQRQSSQKAVSLESMLATLGQGAGGVAEKRVLKLIVKADVRGSLEAIVQGCANIGNDEVSVNVLASGVGGITESDANIAFTYGAAIFGFNTRADSSAKAIIEREGIDLRYYSVIYELFQDIQAILEGMLAPEIREEIVGIAEVREVYRSPRYGQIAGCMVTEGLVARSKAIRVLRDNVVIFEGELESLRRFKDDVTEVRNGLECGIGVRNYNDVRAGDLIEVFESRQVARVLDTGGNGGAAGAKSGDGKAVAESGARELSRETA